MIRRGERKPRPAWPWMISQIKDGRNELEVVVNVPDSAKEAVIEGTPRAIAVTRNPEFVDLGNNLYENTVTGIRVYVIPEPWFGAASDDVIMWRL